MQAPEIIRAKTNEFFRLHWPKTETEEAPVWESWDPFLRTPIPNYDKPGCYALVAGDTVDYVGLAISKGWGAYKKNGISIRLYGHVLLVDKSKDSTYMLREKWRHITGICTIPFPDKYIYLAPALERFLITKLEPGSNHR
uniref:hypothetical protein n=1 Tax=Castellaniella defragrans TaxID=75697 RepID=UPI0033404149